MAGRSGTDTLARLADRIAEEITKGANSSLTPVSAFLEARIKEALSTPVPRTTRISPTGGIVYKPLAPARVGQPPRMLSGKLRSSVRSEIVDTAAGASGKPGKAIVIGANARSIPSSRYPTGFPYGQYHEIKDPSKPGSGRHPFIMPEFQRWKKQLAALIGKSVRLQLGSR